MSGAGKALGGDAVRGRNGEKADRHALGQMPYNPALNPADSKQYRFFILSLVGWHKCPIRRADTMKQ